MISAAERREAEREMDRVHRLQARGQGQQNRQAGAFDMMSDFDETNLNTNQRTRTQAMYDDENGDVDLG